MPNDPSQPPIEPEIKLFPRNLTARAEHLVLGNPASSRPESGVENSFPGLELDQRNLDQRFFGGLYFEFQREDGAILAGMGLDAEQRRSGLQEGDSTPERPLYLWFLYGKAEVGAEKPSLFSFRGKPGMDVWRCVRDLLPGRVTIVLGPAPGVGFYLKLGPTTELFKIVRQAHCATAAADRYHVKRGPGGAIEFAVLSRDRAVYLDDDGVIDVTSYAPGELTKTLCAPWMYDFRDCYCFYWASNKPDLVASADGKAPSVNFLRRRDPADPQPMDIAIWKDRRKQELDYKDMVEGAWHRLPVVLDDQEADPPEAPRVRPPGRQPEKLLGKNEAVAELRELAELEHALAIEYLYAMYSVVVPPGAPDHRGVRFAAVELRAIAIDEMRHFLWANEALALMDAPPSTGRAPSIGRGDERRAFALRPLTRDTLASFIAIEARSRTVDGAYALVLASVTGGSKTEFPQQARLADLLKLIVDEGDAHHRRFVAVQGALGGLDEAAYLRPFKSPPDPPPPDLLLCDEYYRAILTAIHVSFSQGDRAGREITQEGILLMHGLDAAARRLAVAGYAPRFELPRPWPPEGSPGETLEAPALEIQALLSRVAAGVTDDDVAVVDHQRQDIAAWRDRVRRLSRRLFRS